MNHRLAPAVSTAPEKTVDKRRRRLPRLGVGGYLGLGVLLLMALAALLIGFVSPWEPDHIDGAAGPLTSESSQHLFGTDLYGRDLLTRIAYGARVSLIVGLVVSIGAMTVGVLAGLLGAYYGGVIDAIIGRITDSLLAIPNILFAITILAVLGSGLFEVVLALTIVYVPVMIRVTRGSAIAVRERLHVRAARAVGASDRRIIFRHIAPFVVGPVVVQATFVFATAVLYEALLSFLGLGVNPPTPSFGNIVSESLGYMYSDARYVLYPSIFLSLTVLSINLIGDAVRDVLDPQGTVEM